MTDSKLGSGARGATHQVGKYLLTEQIGSGGTAEVWKARVGGPSDFSRILVVKRLHPHLSSERAFLEMFAAEARLSAMLHHANIVQVFEFTEVDGEWVLVMEHIAGSNLSQVLSAQSRRHRPLPVGASTHIVHQIARGLAYAHALTDEHGVALGIIHRDVNPANVMVDKYGSAKLVDFGIAKALPELRAVRTATGMWKGKLAYMAPEQLPGPMRRADIDHRVDQYALGVMLHEMLTGQRLFIAANDPVLMQLLNERAIAPPSSINPAVPPELDAICLRALARDRDERYPHCGAMASALEEVLRRMPQAADQARALLPKLGPPAESTASRVITKVSSVTVRKLPPRARRLAWMALPLALAALGATIVGRHHAAPPPPLRRPAPPPPSPPPPPPPPPETETGTGTETETGTGTGTGTETGTGTITITTKPKAPAPPRKKPARPKRPPPDRAVFNPFQ